MRLDSGLLLRGQAQQYDVCIVGSGPAGIALAHGLAGSSLRVSVLESGGATKTLFADGLRGVESEGIPIRTDSRERILGGASTTWAGLSSPFDEIDFRQRSWVPRSGWPLALTDLVPYYQRASQLFRFPSWDHFADLDWLPDASDRIPRWPGLEAKTFLAADPAQDFGREFSDVFDRPDVDLILGATVTELTGSPETGRVTGVVIRLPDGMSGSIAARVVVLAAGGIENARLLLLSRFAGPAGLGNDNDQVGRHFMNHPKATAGIIELARPQGPLPGYFGFLYPGLGYAGYAGLRLTPAEQERQGVLNSYVRFEPVFGWSDDPGVDAIVRYAKRSASIVRMFRRLPRDTVVALRSYAETGDDDGTDELSVRQPGHLVRLASIVRHAHTVARYLRARLLPTGAPLVTSVRLRNFLEMAPDPSNRISLSNKTDTLGTPVPHVAHRCGELDRRSIVALHGRLSEEITRAGWGRLRSDMTADAESWPIAHDASHHLGATRMGTDPLTSVVDVNLRLHTTDSVYVIGGSVFPTSGCVNPTYTIVALALKLGEHLRAHLRSR